MFKQLLPSWECGKTGVQVQKCKAIAMVVEEKESQSHQVQYGLQKFQVIQALHYQSPLDGHIGQQEEDVMVVSTNKMLTVEDR